ncbi:RrF2 family transcriptional regulator [Oceaniferula spumae]|uniref:RrF2 family transcriptional regulator n=1 Tax=Oceaniferula spumae TaxID=2979115 RepID=UPI003F4EC480
MRISQKLEYACRAMVQLARHHDGQTLTRLDDLAQREAVSANFLVQILNDLKRSGLIISKRGKAGGYLLAREPREINMQHITMAVEPGMLMPNISEQGESGKSVQEAWGKISKSLDQALKEITLDSLSTQSPMFYI